MLALAGAWRQAGDAGDEVAPVRRPPESFARMGRCGPLASRPDSVPDMAFGSYALRYCLHEGALVNLRVWHRREERAAHVHDDRKDT